uniref:Transmembrane protein 254 n=1 Tax=Sarcophilus harrisii TaxID=9305 RepID=G3VUF3_SARHA
MDVGVGAHFSRRVRSWSWGRAALSLLLAAWSKTRPLSALGGHLVRVSLISNKTQFQLPFQWVVFWPQSIPYQKLGLLGHFTQYLVDNHLALMRNGYWLAWLIHVGESIYAMILCNQKGITSGRAQFLWLLQTFFFGIASLSILLAYKPYHHKKK